MKTTVNVIIPCWGTKYFQSLPKAISSVKRQTHQPVEFQVVSFPEHKAAAMNKGAKDARGEFLVFLGADDTLKENYIEKCLSVVTENTGFVWTACNLSGDLNGVRYPRKFPFRGLYLIGYDFGGQLGAMLIRRKAFDSVGGFDTDLFGHEDWDLAIRLIKKGWDFKTVNEPVHNYFYVRKDIRETKKRLVKKYPVFRVVIFWMVAFRMVKRFWFTIIKVMRRLT